MGRPSFFVESDGSYSGGELRHITLTCMHKAIGYVDCNGYQPLRELPLSLLQGDIHANCRDMCASGDILDTVTRNVKICFEADPGPAATVQALELLKQAACSTGLSEKSHGPAALVKKRHPSMEASGVRHEAYIHLHTPMFRMSTNDAKIARLQSIFERALSGVRSTRALSAFNVFRRDVSEGRFQLPEESPGENLPATLLARSHSAFKAWLLPNRFSKRGSL